MYWTFDPWQAVLWGYFWTFVERGLIEGIKPLEVCPYRRVGQRSRLLSSLLPGCPVVSSFASPHCSTVPEWAGWAYMASNLWKHEPKQTAPQWQAAKNEHSHDSLNCVCSCPSVFCLILSDAHGCCQPRVTRKWTLTSQFWITVHLHEVSWQWFLKREAFYSSRFQARRKGVGSFWNHSYTEL